MTLRKCISHFFCYYNDNLRESMYKDRRLILIHSFRGSSLCSIGLVAFGPVARKHIMAGAHGGAEWLTSWQKEVSKKEGARASQPH